MTRTLWAELPVDVRAAVTAHTGPVTAALDVPHGYNCTHASILTTAAGDVFVKAAPAAEAAAFHDREEVAAPFTAGIGPRLRQRARRGAWDVLAFDAVPAARHAHLAPGSADCAVLAGLLQASTTRTAPGNVPPWTSRWAEHATPSEAALLDGRTLVHGDINPHNVLLSAGRAWLVDWAAACRGPAWADVAEAAIRLMEEEHTARDAHAWASRIPAWRDADPAAVTVWADVCCRAWEARIGPADAASSNARHQALAAEAASAVAH
ncbi:phosphotransferase family protein [Streptomyces violaceusniger]|uniref:phosphotransferase family protein n=1 Tax=Streptomyces violaceusniger TaxID=68280 RepID=UPI0002E099EB|nr:phosphotransferase [Streptomyces violaceusniger]